MKKITKAVAMILLGTMLISTTVLAAPSDTPAEKTELKETQSVTKTDYIRLQCPSSQGYVDARIYYTYSAIWEEGYYGEIDGASFVMQSAYVGKGFYAGEDISPVGSAEINLSIAYQQFKVKVNNTELMLRVYVSINEWGDVSMWIAEG